jgi:hypothetical protein
VKQGPGGLLRALARLLVRGPDAPFVLGDMDEAMQRDIARGVGRRRARMRYLANALASGQAVARSRLTSRRTTRLSGMVLDLKLGWRMLGRNPVLTAVATLALAVGIPVGLSPVHIMNAAEAPPPVEDADRLMGLRYQAAGGNGVPTTAWELRRWRETLTSFERLGAVRRMERNVSAEADIGMPLAAAEVSASAFPILRARPLLGRTFREEDETPGAPAVAVLSYETWQRRFDGRADIVGSTVRVAGEPHTVVGVMPAGFLFPVHEQLWLPLRERPSGEAGVGAALSVFGRLKDGASERTAQAELTRAQVGVSLAYPERLEHVRAEVVPVTTMLAGHPKGGIAATAGIGPLSPISVFRILALVLLLVACANVGLLLFARAATRAHELVVRTALGASRTRIVGQIVVEALVLALISAAAGLLLIDVLGDWLLASIWPSNGGVPWWRDASRRPDGCERACAARRRQCGPTARRRLDLRRSLRRTRLG